MSAGGGADSGGMDPEETDVTPGEEEAIASAPPVSDSDTYSTGQAAKLLGRDPSQVRQWVRSGKLNAVSTDPYRLSQESVHRLRDQLRRRDTGGGAQPSNSGASADGHPDVEGIVRAVVNEILPRAIEAHTAASDKVESLYQEQLAFERDRAQRAEATAAEAKAEADRRLAEQQQEHQAELERARAEREAEVERLRAEAEAAREEPAPRRGLFGRNRGRAE
ncbi:helix-turn-helix protein [Haloactinopolyspora alba]|uniref:Helix-turn-helix protein n=1 Tax=Haloactinopolyspora alba TaxID=648780 RepID=A0A2P8DF49_9ACTN|nr:helix-turn-helix domain-containing protein [Haloactinopolyspora alba]PSK95828.1 helix-turn-helix protein [Haloactinopolyspora alba]